MEQRDTGLIPEPMLVELDQQGVIRDYAASENYPAEEIIHLAQLAGVRDATNIDNFLEQLLSGNPVRSYWAATGLLLLGRQALAALPVMESVLERIGTEGRLLPSRDEARAFLAPYREGNRRRRSSSP